jgi:conjugal transfer/entry exclusion protein
VEQFRETEVAKKMLVMKEKIEKYKNEKTLLEGQLKMLMEQLQNKYGLSSLDEVEENLENIQKELEELRGKILLGLQTLEKELNEADDE